MFSLIIALISIALVAALALATLYYGGDSFNQSAAKAQAAKIVNQQQQLLGATDLFISEKGRIPNGVAELVSTGFLKTAPVAMQGVGSVVAAGDDWVMPAPGEQVVFVLPNPDTEVCQAYNERMMGMDGISPQAHEGYTSQCYGELGSHKVVVGKTSTALADAAGITPAVLATSEYTTAGLPPVENESSWVVVPSSLVSTGGGQSQPPADPAPVDPPPAQPVGSVVALASNTAQNLTFTAGGAAVSGVVTYSNTGDAPVTLTFSGVSAPFSLSATSCTAAASASCSVTVTLDNSTAVGDVPPQTLTATGADSGIVTTQVSASVRGSVAELISSASITVPSQAYGVYDGNTVGSFSLRNAGNEPMTLNIVNLDVPFGYANTCVNVAPGATCAINIYWSWVTATPQTFTSYLTFNGAAAGNRNDLSVTGTLEGSYVSSSASFSLSADYSSSNANRPTQTLTVTNTGNVVGSFSFTPTSSRFKVDSHTCSSVQPGANCTVTISMDTNWYFSGGARDYTSLVVGGASNYLQIYGSGFTYATEAQWENSTTAFDFGTAPLNTPTSLTRVVRNVGNKPWAADGLVYNAPTDLVSNFVANCGTLQPGQACTVTFTYQRKFTRPNWSYSNVYLGANFSNMLTMRGNTP